MRRYHDSSDCDVQSRAKKREFQRGSVEKVGPPRNAARFGVLVGMEVTSKRHVEERKSVFDKWLPFEVLFKSIQKDSQAELPFARANVERFECACKLNVLLSIHLNHSIDCLCTYAVNLAREMKSFRDTIHFIDLSGAEPIQRVCKGETEGGKKHKETPSVCYFPKRVSRCFPVNWIK